MSNKSLYKSGFNISHVIITIVLLLPGLEGFVNDYILFFIIYSSILYLISSIYLKQVHLFIDNILIKYPLSFWKNDIKINYFNVIEFKHYTFNRNPAQLQVKYKDIDNQIKTIKFPCELSKANMLMKEIKKKHAHISYKTHTTTRL